MIYVHMINKYSIASKARWNKIPSASKTKMMRDVALSGWSKLSPEQRSLRAKKAAKTRLKNKKLLKNKN